MDLTEAKEKLNEALKTLNYRERMVLKLRFGLGKEGNTTQPNTFEEVGEIFKTPRERIRQLEAKALRKLEQPDRIEKIWEIADALSNMQPSDEKEQIEMQRIAFLTGKICESQHARIEGTVAAPIYNDAPFTRHERVLLEMRLGFDNNAGQAHSLQEIADYIAGGDVERTHKIQQTALRKLKNTIRTLEAVPTPSFASRVGERADREIG